MRKNEREQKWNSTAKVNSKSQTKTYDDDIANLNDDDSFAPINEEETPKLTEEEKVEVRKKLFLLLIVIIVVILLFSVVLIFDPFKQTESKKDNSTKEEQSKNNEETNDEDLSIVKRENGTIDLTNEEIKKLESEVIYKYYEYYNNDTLALYRNTSNDINNLDNKTKLFLVSKTKDFVSIIEDKVFDTTICNDNITIPISKIDEILKNRFATTITQYEEFIFSYYKNDEFIQDIKFTKLDNSYIGTCYESQKQVDSLVQQSISKATKEDNNLYIDFKVVFVKSSGVYKDPTFTTLITNDQNTTIEDYINQGNIYRYTYNINDGKFSLINISLLK